MRTIRRGGSHELEVRRSRFVCTLARVDTEAAAVEFIARHRKAHHAATHNCTAYVLGEWSDITRSSDDGEPSGTAGIPMLEVLLRRELTDTLAVVTRYFGGVKLGAGGLVRAYGQSVSAAVDLVGVVERRPVVTVSVLVEHGRAGRFENDLRSAGHEPVGVRYAAGVEVDVLVLADSLDAFDAWVASATAGQAVVVRGTEGYVEVPVS
jgi:uncharacterized YigZ family protein